MAAAKHKLKLNNYNIMSNVLIIKTSPRLNGNSDALADEFARGAAEAGHMVETVSLVGREVAFCRGCLACQNTHGCVIHDYADEVRQKMHDADVIVWATPVYYYSVSGQMKTMIDRSNPLYGSDYKFRDVYLLAAAAEDEATTVNGAVTALEGWIACFERSRLAGVVFAGGVNERGDIAGHASLIKAYEAGRAVGA